MNRGATLSLRNNPAVWILPALLIFQSAGWLMAWQCMHWNARLEARNALFQGNALPEKTFSKAFFDQIKVEKKEIRLDGHLYDFYTVAETKDSISVALYHDQKEQAMLTALGQLFQSGRDSSQSSVPGLIHWLAQSLGAAFLPTDPVELPVSPALVCHSPLFQILSWGAQDTPGVFAPPPESAKG